MSILWQINLSLKIYSQNTLKLYYGIFLQYSHDLIITMFAFCLSISLIYYTNTLIHKYTYYVNSCDSILKRTFTC